METAPSSLPTTAARLLSKFAACAATLLLTLFFLTFCVSCTTARSLSPPTSPRVRFLSEIEPDSDSGSGSGDDEDGDNDFSLSTETPDDDILGGIVINNQIGPQTLALGYLYAAGQLVFLGIIIILLILCYRRYVLATALIVQRQVWSSEAAVRNTFSATVEVPARNPAVTPCNCSCKFEEMVFYYTTSGFMVLVGIILLLTALVRLANWIVDQMESRSSRRGPLPPPLDYVGPRVEDHIYDEPHHGRVPELGQYMQMK